jgi:hypothetical protein
MALTDGCRIISNKRLLVVGLLLVANAFLLYTIKYTLYTIPKALLPRTNNAQNESIIGNKRSAVEAYSKRRNVPEQRRNQSDAILKNHESGTFSKVVKKLPFYDGGKDEKKLTQYLRNKIHDNHVIDGFHDGIYHLHSSDVQPASETKKIIEFLNDLVRKLYWMVSHYSVVLE